MWHFVLYTYYLRLYRGDSHHYADNLRHLLQTSPAQLLLTAVFRRQFAETMLGWNMLPAGHHWDGRKIEAMKIQYLIEGSKAMKSRINLFAFGDGTIFGAPSQVIFCWENHVLDSLAVWKNFQRIGNRWQHPRMRALPVMDVRWSLGSKIKGSKGWNMLPLKNERTGKLKFSPRKWSSEASTSNTFHIKGFQPFLLRRVYDLTFDVDFGHVHCDRPSENVR